MQVSSYQALRPEMKIGDLLAFSGRGFVSKGIQWATRSPISHVGTILRFDPESRVDLIESTTLDGKKGVQTNYLSERIKEYPGEVWYLQMTQSARAACDWTRWMKFLDAQMGKRYDYRQCLQMICEPLVKIPLLGALFENHPSVQRWYCSELIAGALMEGGVVPFGSINYSETSPADLCKWPIWETPIQLKGSPKEIA